MNGPLHCYVPRPMLGFGMSLKNTLQFWESSHHVNSSDKMDTIFEVSWNFKIEFKKLTSSGDAKFWVSLLYVSFREGQRPTFILIRRDLKILQGHPNQKVVSRITAGRERTSPEHSTCNCTQTQHGWVFSNAHSAYVFVSAEWAFVTNHSVCTTLKQ